jgi:hypothetical protein
VSSDGNLHLFELLPIATKVYEDGYPQCRQMTDGMFEADGEVEID